MNFLFFLLLINRLYNYINFKELFFYLVKMKIGPSYLTMIDRGETFPLFTLSIYIFIYFYFLKHFFFISQKCYPIQKKRLKKLKKKSIENLLISKVSMVFFIHIIFLLIR